MAWIEVEDRGVVRWVTLNRPERLNAVPADGWGDLADVFRAAEASEARVVVVTGAGGSFCSGVDLDQAAGMAGAGVVAMKERMGVVAAAVLSLHRLTKPTIAAVDGAAVGAGMNLAIGCDVVVATERARFSEAFVRRGLTVDFGGTWILPRLVGSQRAKELVLSGRLVEAPEALAMGLCLDVVPPERLERRVTELAESFIAGAPLAQMFAKQGIDRSWELSLEDALDWEGQSQAICRSTEDAAEGIASYREKRSPIFRGR